VEGDDVGVLQPRQRLVFIAPQRGDLQDDGPIREVRLRCEVDAAVRAARQLGGDPEVLQPIADLGEARSGGGAIALGIEQPAMAVKHEAQRIGPAREAAQNRLLDGVVVTVAV
jgi:hypothetical protein